MHDWVIHDWVMDKRTHRLIASGSVCVNRGLPCHESPTSKHPNWESRRRGILTEPTLAVRFAQADLEFDIADSATDATGGIRIHTMLVVDAARIVRFADVQTSQPAH